MVVSGIVQNWYLSVGRAQEKKAGRHALSGDVQKKRWSAAKKGQVTFVLSLPGIVFGLLAWLAFIIGIVSVREMGRTGDSTKKGLAIAAIVIGGIFGPVRSILNLIVRVGGLQ